MKSARATVTAISHRVGRRGQALLVFGFIDFVIAYSLIDPSTRTQAAAVPAYRAMWETLPIIVWGWLWAGIGLACVVQAFARRDAVGFGAAIGIKVVWTLGFLASWLIWDAQRGWIGAATWAVMARLVHLIAGWPEPLDPKDLEPAR